MGVIYYYLIYDCKVKWRKEYQDLIYIGQTNNPEKRHSDHLCPSKKKGQVVNTMLQTHKYEYGVLWEGDESMLDNKEVEYINELYAMYPYGLNFTTGGFRPSKRKEAKPKSETWKRKHSERMRATWARKKEQGIVWVTGGGKTTGVRCHIIDENEIIHQYETIRECAIDLQSTPTSVRKSLYSEKRKVHSPKYGPVKVLLSW